MPLNDIITQSLLVKPFDHKKTKIMVLPCFQACHIIIANSLVLIFSKAKSAKHNKAICKTKERTFISVAARPFNVKTIIKASASFYSPDNSSESLIST